MGFWDRIKNSQSSEVPQLDIRFGRYTDSYKSSSNYQAWDKALEAFGNEDFLESYRQFFLYLGDEKEENVKFWESEDGIRFELFQGSKKICGFANKEKVKAESKVAQAQSLNVGFMRRLIEKNFSMEYCRFGLDDHNNIMVLFDTYTLDGSPYKLYYALKELAISADKQDDLLLDEFSMLKEVETSHLVYFSDNEKAVKYDYIISQIKDTLSLVDKNKLPFEQYPGAYVYLILGLIYKLDYLTRPEGYLMERLEFLTRQYFAKDNKKTLEKAQALVKELKLLLNRPKEDFYKEMYRGISTFGITEAVNQDRVVACIDNELINMDWYIQNGHPKIAQSIPNFIVGYCLFNYAVPRPVRSFFHLYYQVVESKFFTDLQFNIDYFDVKNQRLNTRSIKKGIQKIVNENRRDYPKLRPNTNLLKYKSLLDFSKSYLNMIRNLDLTKIQR